MAESNQAGEASSTIAGSFSDDNGQPIANGEITTTTGRPVIQAAPPIPEQMTLRQFKALRAKYFTVKHKRMDPCGHRLDAMNEPRNNCEFCWFAFFQTHGELVQTTDRAYQEQGTEFLDRTRGQKYRKMFLRFMSTIAMFKKEMEDAKGKNDGQAGEVESSNGFGEDARQEIRFTGDITDSGRESGPTSSCIPNPIAII